MDRRLNHVCGGVRAVHSVWFESAAEAVLEKAESPLADVDDGNVDNRKSVKGEWRPDRTGANRDEPDELTSTTVNMPFKRNLDEWCFAEHMDMPVLLQVVRYMISGKAKVCLPACRPDRSILSSRMRTPVRYMEERGVSHFGGNNLCVKRLACRAM